MQGLFVQLEAGRHETWLSSPVLLFITCATLGKAYNLYSPSFSPLAKQKGGVSSCKEVEGPRTWCRREGLLGGLNGQPLIAKLAWGWWEEMAFTLGMVSYRLLQIQMHVKLFIVKRVAVGRLPEQVWVFAMGCISAGNGSARVLARARGPSCWAIPSPPQAEGQRKWRVVALVASPLSSVLLGSTDMSHPGAR